MQLYQLVDFGLRNVWYGSRVICLLAVHKGEQDMAGGLPLFAKVTLLSF